jgi:hypothetical protein
MGDGIAETAGIEGEITVGDFIMIHATGTPARRLSTIFHSAILMKFSRTDINGTNEFGC